MNANFGQFIVNTKNNEDREVVRARLLKVFDEDFPEVRGRVNRLENGPPVGFPVQFRVVGEDKEKIREIANEVAAVMRANPWTREVNFDWEEPSKVIRLDHRPEPRARARHLDAGAVAVREHRALRPGRHDVSRGRQGRST